MFDKLSKFKKNIADIFNLLFGEGDKKKSYFILLWLILKLSTWKIAL